MGRFSKLETQAPRETSYDAHRPDLLEPGLHAPTSDEGAVLEEHDLPAMMAQGDLALYREDYRGAMRWYSRAIDRDGHNLESWTAMIRALLLQNQLSESYTWIGRGLTVFPNDNRLIALRAVNYARRGMVRQAMNNSDAVLERSPNDPQAHIARGEVLLLAENKNADYCFDQALKITPSTDFKTPMMIGMILEERRLFAAAINWYARAAERHERLPALWWRVARCRARLGHQAQAEKALQTAREMCAPDDPLYRHLDQVAGRGWLTGALQPIRSLFKTVLRK